MLLNRPANNGASIECNLKQLIEKNKKQQTNLQVSLLAMDMIASVYQIKDPSRGHHISIRIGIHTGPVVGGIVGQKMPR